MNPEQPKLEVCEAVALVLQRMESNPDEFIADGPDPFTPTGNRWAKLVQQYWQHLNQHEQNLLKDKKQEIHKAYYRNEFKKAVMKELLVGKEDPNEFQKAVYR